MRILILDDNPADRALARREVQRNVAGAEIIEAANRSDLEAALAHPLDVCVLDYSLGWSSGPEALKLIRRADPDVGAVLFTGSLGEELAVEALKSGFDDYVIKDAGKLARLRAAVASLADRVRERRASRRLRERYEHLFETVPVGLFVCDRTGAFQAGNPGLLELLGVADVEALRRLNLFALMNWEGPPGWSALEAADRRGVEAQLVVPGGGPRSVLVHASKAGDEDVFEGVITDVTDLRRAVEERDLLLREVFHRVYNNLQSVQGLLRTQSRQFPDPAVRRAFNDVSDRIGAMALVQQKLHKGDDYRRVDFAGYLQDLVQASRGLHGGAGVDLNAEPLKLDIERAVPLGLIANELLTNALKHGVPGSRAGQVRVDLHRADGSACLIVADDGPGTDGREPEGGVGALLVRRLAEQINAELTFHHERGLRAQVRMPL